MSTVLVGMGPGLGLALVRRFARAGGPVAFIGRRAEALAAFEAQLRAEGLDAAGFVADAGKPQTMDEAFAAIRRYYGEPEALIYNAAIIEPARFVTPSGLPFVQYGNAPGWYSHGVPADFDYLVECFKINVAGALHAARQVSPAKVARGQGSILFTGGVLAFDPWLEWGVTALGKAALRSLGISLHRELVPFGIRAHVVAIHGTMEEGTPYDPALVAEAYWQLHHGPRHEEPDFHFKPET
jgi:NAD(P)-dependent dehydrogenase (short-subunit alcohol dehydrogenase family)